MHTFGITNHLDPVVSLCLGPCDVSVREMVTAYTAFSNKGLRVDPIYVTKITDNNGNVISEFTPQYTEVMSQEAYFKMVNILQNVINSGTGSRLRRAPYNITAVMGGKTGTTNYNADGWFMGFTPNLVSGVWRRRALYPFQQNGARSGSRNGIAYLRTVYEKSVCRQVVTLLADVAISGASGRLLAVL